MKGYRTRGALLFVALSSGGLNPLNPDYTFRIGTVKWLNAGAMQDGVVTHAEEGTPQGGSISPVLSNLYIHFVLDLWFEKKIKPQCRGEAYLVRFADDFVVSFQSRQDVDHFQKHARERFAKFGLELAEEKTRRILFGRFADLTCQRHGLGRPETFEFLGFKHVCGVDRKGALL